MDSGIEVAGPVMMPPWWNAVVSGGIVTRIAYYLIAIKLVEDTVLCVLFFTTLEFSVPYFMPGDSMGDMLDI